MLSLEDYAKAHKKYPFAVKYRNKPENCHHIYDFIVFCNSETDIVRCRNCGSEIETSCNFDDDYD